MSDIQEILSTYHLPSCTKAPCTCRMDEAIDEVCRLEAELATCKKHAEITDKWIVNMIAEDTADTAEAEKAYEEYIEATKLVADELE